MKFALYSEVDEASIRENLGRSEYSYYFVLKSFLPALERLGTTVRVHDPAAELDAIFADCDARGERCLFISFSPPNKAFIDHDHPMVVVFAWEFSTIPDEAWDDDPRNDWRYVFARHGRAITLSSHTTQVVRAAMGESFPILAAGAPVWDRFDGLRARLEPRPIIDSVELRLDGLILDSRAMDLSPDYLLGPEPPIPEPPRPEPIAVEAAPEPEPEPVEPEPVELEPPPVEPAPVGAVVAEEPVFEPAPLEAQPIATAPRKGLRYRLSITKRLALEWYREVIRDLFPGWLAWIVSRIGRLVYRVYRLLFRGRRPMVAEASASSPSEPAVVEAPVSDEVADELVIVEPMGATTDIVSGDENAAVEPAAAEVQAEPSVEAVHLPEPPPRWPEARVSLDGVVYTSVLNPTDGRKNYKDLITAFCWAFRDVGDATLVLKMVQGNLARWYHPYIQMLSQLSPFKCRVVALHGYLEDDEYRKMIEASTYYVNASCCEGLCLPLMEFMSCRRPAVTPDHTAMGDYVDPSNSFIVGGTLEHNVWPHDPRDLFRTERYRIEWESLLHAYEDSYRVAKEDPIRYRAMAESASNSMHAHNSDSIVAARLDGFLTEITSSDTASPFENAVVGGEPRHTGDTQKVVAR